MSAPGGGGDYNANVVLTANVSQYQQSMGDAQKATDHAAGSIEKLIGSYGRLKQATRTKFISWDKEAAVTLTASVAAAALYEKQLSTLSATAAVTGKSMNGFRDAIDGAFAKLPVSRGEITALATQLNQLGVTAPQDIGKLIVTFEKLGAVTGAAPAQLAAAMMQFTQSMGDTSTANVRAMSDQLVSLSKNAGISAQSVLNFAQAISPIARVAGIGESQVLALSGAFSKAGADGYVAANAFNSMVADITQLSAAGSPQLAKYANSLGLTADQFKKMPAANAVAALFDKVNKEGAAGINTLNQWGINGVRAITAVQQVAQSGQLDSLLNASSNDQSKGSLDKGAAAAMGGLSDALAETRNEFTMYGTYVGQHLIGPTTSFIHVINSAVQALSLLKPLLAPVLGIVGVGGQALGTLASVASPLLMGAWMMRGPVGRNARMGWNIGRASRISPEAGLAAQERYTAMGRVTDPKEMRAMSRLFYGAGLTGGQYTQRAIFGETGESQRGLILRNIGLRLPGMAVRSLMGSQRDYMNNAVNRAGFEAPKAEAAVGLLGRAATLVPRTARAGLERVQGLWGASGTAASALQREAALQHAQRLSGEMRATGQAATTPLQHAALRATDPSLTQAQREAAIGHVGRAVGSEALVAGASKSEKALLAMTGAAGKVNADFARLEAHLAETVKKLEAANTVEGRATSTFKVLQDEVLKTAAEMGRLAGTTAAASARILGQAAGNVAGRALPMVGRGLMNFGKEALTNPWLMIPMLAMGGMKVKDMVENRVKDTTDTTGKYLNPIQQYNTQLGIATTNLASLSNAANNAAIAMNANAGGVTVNTPMATVRKVTHEDDLAAAQQGTSKDKNITALVSSGKKNVGALRSYLQTLDVNDPRVMQQFKVNAIAAGFDDYTVRQAISGSGSGTSYAPLARAAMGMEGKGTFATNPSKAAAGILDSIQTKVLNDFTKNQTQFGEKYASQLQLQDIVGVASAAGAGIKGSVHSIGNSGNQGYSPYGGYNPIPKQTNESTRADIQKKAIAQSLAEQFGGDYMDYYRTLVGTDLSTMSESQRQQFILDKVVRSTPEGSKTLDAIKAAGGTTQVSQFGAVDRTLRMGGMSKTSQAALAAQGPLGAWALHSKDIQASAQAPEDVGKANKAMTDFAQQALKVGGNFGGAIEMLQKVKAGIQDSTNATYQAADAAQQWVASLQQGAMGQSMSRGQQGAMLAGNLTRAARNLDNGAPDSMGKFQSAQGAMQSYTADQNQYLIQMKQQADAYGLQMRRSREDEQVQTQRSRDAFDLQMLNSDADHRTQRARAYRDFNKQMARMAEDEAKAIYNPFQRVQPKFTADANTVLQNLQDQNGRIKNQSKELGEARRLGLSKQAIKQLDLANPENAQQLDNIVQTLRNNPQVAAAINAQIAERVKVTAKLAKSTYSETYTRAVDDFRQGLKDTQDDYDLARQRAVDAQAKAMGYMRDDYKKMIRRSGEDLNTAMTEINTNFGQSYGGAFKSIVDNVLKFAPIAGKTMLANLKGLDPYIKFASTYGGLLLTPGAVGNSPLTPNTLGLNNKNQIGEYDAKGKWHPYKGYVSPSQAAGLTHVFPPAVMPPAAPPKPKPKPKPKPHPPAHQPVGHTPSGGMQYNAATTHPSAAATPVPRHVVLKAGTAHHPSGMAGHRSGSTTIHQDFSTQFNGAITVQAQDTKTMIRELQARQRLAKLSRPTQR